MSYLTESDNYQWQEADGTPMIHSDVVAHLGDEYADVPVIVLRLTWVKGHLSAVVSSRPNDLLPRGAVTSWAAASDSPPSHVAPQAIAAHEHWSVAPSALVQGF